MLLRGDFYSLLTLSMTIMHPLTEKLRDFTELELGLGFGSWENKTLLLSVVVSSSCTEKPLGMQVIVCKESLPLELLFFILFF